MIRPLAQLFLGLISMAAAAAIAAAQASEPPIALTVQPVLLDPWNPQRRQAGRLVFRGGVVLTSSDARFGGLSGLIVPAGGRSFVAVSDRGFWVRGALGYNGKGDLISVSGVRLEPITGPAGLELTGRPWRDAESLAVGTDGAVVIAFEDAHRLWSYAGRDARPIPVPPPPRLERAPRNGGIEALTVVPPGHLVALSERLEVEGGVVGWVNGPGGDWTPFTYAVDGGFRPTGATTLADGSVLVLERRFPPVGARVRRISPASLTAETLGEGRGIVPDEVAMVQEPLSVDNMEGIDARQTDDGRTLVYLVSDDNYSNVQRTLLLMFELVEEAAESDQNRRAPSSEGGEAASAGHPNQDGREIRR